MEVKDNASRGLADNQWHSVEVCYDHDNNFDYDDDCVNCGNDADHDDDGLPAYSHHDKNPPWWEFVSNEYGGNMPVMKIMVMTMTD